MKTKAHCASQTSISFRILTIVGAVSLLSALTGNGQSIGATNSTAPFLPPALVEVGPGILTTAPTFSLGLPPTPTRDATCDTNGNLISTSGLYPSAEGPVLHPAIVPPRDPPASLLPTGLLSNPAGRDGDAAGFVATRAFPDLTTSPARAIPTLLLGSSVLVLQEPRSDPLNRHDPPAGLKLGRSFAGDVAVRFFVPASKPAPPGRGHDLVSGESDRPWPVVAAGAAMGKCWNDPGVYQPQHFLLLDW